MCPPLCVFLYMGASNKADGDSLRNSERTPDANRHGDMSKSPFAENTQRIIDEGIECGNDFASLALSGESLRGHSMMKDLNVIPPELATYDAFIAGYNGEVHDDFEKMMAECMSELYAYANQSRLTREWEDGTWLLDDINGTLSVAAALTRAGRYELSKLKALAERTRQAVWAITPKLCDLMQYAEDHQLIYMSDNWSLGLEPIFDVYSFWECLACMSPSRIELQVIVQRAARKQRIIEQAMQAFDAKHRQGMIDDAVAKYIANGPKE
jgi:hypothetical protein